MTKSALKFYLLVFVSISVCLSCSNAPVNPVRKIFEINNISTNYVEYSPSFSDNGKEVYFTRSTGKWGQGGGKSAIYYSHLKNGMWSTPTITSFSGDYNDSAPHICNEGKTLFFTSTRPSDKMTKVSKDIWKVERDLNGTWGIPVRLNDSINSERSEYSPRTDKFGNLYFVSNRPGGYGQGDIYFARKEEDNFSSPVNLGAVINSEYGEWNMEINSTGNVLIFESSGRDQNLSPYGDLYISFKNKERWSKPQNIQELNTRGSDLYAEFAKDDTLLYYASSDSLKSVNVDIYVIEVHNIVKKYRKKAVFDK